MSKNQKLFRYSIYIDFFRAVSVFVVGFTFMKFFIYWQEFRLGGTITSFCDNMLGFMFYTTSGYVILYALVVCLDRPRGNRANEHEVRAYIAYVFIMALVVACAYAVKNGYDFSLSIPEALRVSLPSAALALLLLLFDLIIVYVSSIPSSQQPDDKYWYYVFGEAVKLDAVIFSGFLFTLAVATATVWNPGLVNSDSVRAFIAGSEAMLFLISVFVFAFDAIFPGRSLTSEIESSGVILDEAH